MLAHPEPERRPVSLRIRLLLLAVLVLAISLGLVGLALNSAYSRSSETDLHNQMETWAYLVLGATEISEDGNIRVQDDIGDPRLSQPSSGVYVHVHGDAEEWNSPSSLGVDLPELATIASGENQFVATNDNNGYYTYQIGLAWELEDQTVRPFTVTVFVEGSKLAKQIRSFRRGLWKSLGGAGVILAIAQLLFFALSLRPLQRVAEDVAKVESGERESLQGPYPIELEPLTRNLDRLMATEKANQARYRSALDSLAHSLKTPLAVIRAGLASENEAAAMANAVEEMQHLIASRLERAAASTRRTLSAPVPVQEQADRIIASLHKIYSHKLKTPDVIIPPGLNFFGEKRDLMEMMGNLLDNACKYGEGEVRLSAG
ncbi:MAG: two-component system sensor histidine kinase PhoQ, partial [Rhodothermales bacterium]